jgi:hypothetical protein
MDSEELPTAIATKSKVTSIPEPDGPGGDAPSVPQLNRAVPGDPLASREQND